jgi:hypothetical protein
MKVCEFLETFKDDFILEHDEFTRYSGYKEDLLIPDEYLTCRIKCVMEKRGIVMLRLDEGDLEVALMMTRFKKTGLNPMEISFYDAFERMMGTDI